MAGSRPPGGISARRGAGSAAAGDRRRAWQQFLTGRLHAMSALAAIAFVTLSTAHRHRSNDVIDLAAAEKVEAALRTIADLPTSEKRGSSLPENKITEALQTGRDRLQNDQLLLRPAQPKGMKNAIGNTTVTAASTAAKSAADTPHESNERLEIERIDPHRRSGDSSIKTKAGRPNRFPRYSTPEFLERCGWILNAAERYPPSNCTFFYGPSEMEVEGISWWSTQIVSSHLLAMQSGCRILFDYGPQVDIHEVLVPYPGLGSAESEQLHNWTVPPGFQCDQDDHCHQLPRVKGPQVLGIGNTLDFEVPGRGSLAKVPRYRYAYSLASFKLKDHISDDLELALPGFNLETGMACSLGMLFHLAPNASQFEPGLHKMLPILHDEDALVIGLYIRTDWADWSRGAKSLIRRMANKSYFTANNTLTSEGKKAIRQHAKVILDSAIGLEKRYLIGRTEPEREFSKIVWMVTTDSPHIKEWIVNDYDGKDANDFVPKWNKKRKDEKKYGSRVIPRTVLTTGARGKHTRFSDKPSTDVFAEALIDWYLLGESDLVIQDKYSFAETAGLRTARAVYKRGNLLTLVQ